MSLSLKYIGHGNAGLVVQEFKSEFESKFESKSKSGLLKFIPCVSYNDCIALAGLEGLCTSSVASTLEPVFPKRNKCTIFTPQEFKKSKWFQGIKNFPFPKRWLQSCKKTSWDTFPWFVLMIESSEFLYPLDTFLPKTQEEFDYIFFSLLKGIQSMQESFQMVHGDLHLGNVMVRLTPKQSTKELKFRISDNQVLVKTFQNVPFDIVIVDWEKAISPKLFGYKTTHAHLQRMIPLFYKHKMNIVPMQFIDLEMLRADTLPNISQGKFNIPKIEFPNPNSKKYDSYQVGLYPTDYLGIQDPSWMTRQFLNANTNANANANTNANANANTTTNTFEDSISIKEVFPPNIFDTEILPPWDSQSDFLENFEKEYFLYNRPMHRYNLPPFDWERKQFCELQKDILDLYSINVSSWPTSIPRPIRKRSESAVDYLKRQQDIIVSFYNPNPNKKSPHAEYLKAFF